MGLPRSNLVKPKSGAPAAHAMPQLAPFTFAPPALPAGIPLPPGMNAPPTAFAAPAPFAEPSPHDAAMTREAFDTKADSIEVDIAEPRGLYASAPSTNELLERAAALGPARMTWESIVLPADPILDEKRQPHVAERRARLTRFVKLGLGACLAMCVVALGVSALSGESPSERNAGAASVGKTVASKGIVPVEPLGGTKHAKVVRRGAPAPTTAAIVRPKRR